MSQPPQKTRPEKKLVDGTRSNSAERAEETTTGASGGPVRLLRFDVAFERLANQMVGMRNDSHRQYALSERRWKEQREEARKQHEEARKQHAKEMGALRDLAKGLGTRVGRLETRVERIERHLHLFHSADRIRLQQTAGCLAVSETSSTDVAMQLGYRTPRGGHSGGFVTTPSGHDSRSKSYGAENRTPIGSARYKSVGPPSTPSDPRPTLLQSVGLVTVSKPQSNPSFPGVIGADPNQPKPTAMRKPTALPTFELQQGLPAAGTSSSSRQMALSTAASVSQVKPTACNPSTSRQAGGGLPAAVEMETPTPPAERFCAGTRWTREELAAVRDLLRTLHCCSTSAPNSCICTYSVLVTTGPCALHKLFVCRL